MFSLYRAWLSMSSPSPSLPLNLGAPHNAHAPDVQLQVGPSLTHFSAHRDVLCAHSGYFKAALSDARSSSVPVPNVAVDEFSSLLTFMYTGYLDLDLGNIYNILLATHILHMPRALELCRSFLMQQQQQAAAAATPPTSSIVKPIACHKPLPNIEFTDAAEKIEKTPLGNSTRSVFRHYHHHAEDAAGPSTSCEKPAAPEQAPKKEKKKRRAAPCAIAPPAEERAVVDVACCDGPVRFHRVVNKNYGRKQPHVAAAAAAEEGDEATDKERTTLAAINKIMTENIKLAANENRGDNAASTTATVDLYTCLYCNHTFKSQYCYQKHARRHLNPDAAPPDGKQSNAAAASSSSAAAAGGKREFKLLDMNVQYYPCKTCGSKFPSYYFVHKHRKLCHADEMADGSNKNNEMVQVKPAKPKRSAVVAAAVAVATDAHEDTTTGSDIIDVEETN